MVFFADSDKVIFCKLDMIPTSKAKFESVLQTIVLTK